MSEPLLSIITVTRNNARGLKMTTKSLALQQQFTNFEWIVIDGVSTDNTAEIVGEFEKDNTVFISEPDKGIYDAMNKGLDRASGRYVWFMNAGDCFPDSYTLRDVAKQIQTNLPDFIYGDARENGHIKKAHDPNRYLWGQITHHQAMVYSRTLLGKDIRYRQEYKIAADYAFTLEVLARARKPTYLPRFLCDFQTGGISQIRSLEARWENYYIRRDLLGLHPFKNKLIFWLNGFTHFVKTKLPFVYWRARTSSR